MGKLKYSLLCMLVVMATISCTIEKNNTESVYDVLYVRNNKADMPVHIAGNTSSNIFILLLHGGPGGNGLIYRTGPFINAIEKNYAVAYWDQRGQGMSQGHLTDETISIKEMIGDMKAVISVLKHKYGQDIQIFLMGHSWGGTLGAAYLSEGNNQEDIAGWIEVDGAHNMDLIFSAAIRQFQQIGNEQLTMGNSTEFWEETLETVKEKDSLNYEFSDFATLNRLAYKAEAQLTLDSILAADFGEISDIPIILKNYLFTINPITAFFTGTITNLDLTYNDQVFSTNFSSVFEKLEIPTLLMWGKYDLVVPIDLGYEAYQLLKTEEKEFVIFEHSGHSPMANEATLFGEVVIAFIEKYK